MKKVRSDYFFVFSDTKWNPSADYVRQTCYELSKRGFVVCLIWNDTLSIKEYLLSRYRHRILFKPSPQIIVFEPLLWIPFKRFETVRNFNLLLNLALLFFFSCWQRLAVHNLRVITWIFHPYYNEIVSKWKRFTHVIVFDQVDNLLGSLKGRQKQIMSFHQKALAQKADIVVANSHYLRDELFKYNKNVLLAPQGFDISAFARRLTRGNLTKRPITSKPIIGFAGGINDRIDYSLVTKLANLHPEWEFWFWGSFQPSSSQEWLKEWEALIGMDNVKFGSCDRSQLSEVYSKFSVGIIPYKTQELFNRYCHPMKVFEYFYFGLPVVSAPIHELTFAEYRPYVRIANNLKEWEESIDNFLKFPLKEIDISSQMKFCLTQTWEKKISLILEQIDKID